LRDEKEKEESGEHTSKAKGVEAKRKYEKTITKGRERRERRFSDCLKN